MLAMENTPLNSGSYSKKLYASGPGNEIRVSTLGIVNSVLEVLFIIAFAVIGKIMIDYFPANWQGFFCGDENLSYPYIPERFSVANLYILVSVYPALLVIFYEAGICIYERMSKRDYLLPALSLGRMRIPPFIARVWFFLVIYFMAFTMDYLVRATLVGYYGSLKPYFLTVCEPDYRELNCTDRWHNPEYIANYTCYGKNRYLIDESRTGFPAAHASCSFLAAVFLMVYAQYRISGENVFKFIIQFTALCEAIFITAESLGTHNYDLFEITAGMVWGILNMLYWTRVYADFKHLPNWIKWDVEGLRIN